MSVFKRLLTVALTAVIIASAISLPVTAAETDDAIKLEKLGVLKGAGSGVDAAYRRSVPTRYQAAWLFLRLLGREKDAVAWPGNLKYTDTDTARDSRGNTLNTENKRMLSYIYTHQYLGFQGYPDNTFRPFVEINAQMYYKLMLVALGYVEGTDFTWDTVFSKAIQTQLISSAPSTSARFTIDALAAATVQTLQAKMKNGSKTLLEKLIEDDKAISGEKAADAGLYGRPRYSPTMDPIVSKADIPNLGPAFENQLRLPDIYTGRVTIEYDMASSGAEGMVGFVDKDVMPYFQSYNHMSLQIRMTGGAFDVRNGSLFKKDATVTFAADRFYHVKVIANMAAHTYSVWVDGTQIAADYEFRTNDPIARAADDLAMVVLASGTDRAITIKNLLITDDRDSIKIISVTADNMGELNVALNKPIDSAKLAGSLFVDGLSAAAVLSADGKSISVTVPIPKSNGSTYTLLVKKAIGLDVDYSASVTVFDTSNPTVIASELQRADTINLIFNEILAGNTGTVKINGGMYGISGRSVSGKILTIRLASPSLPDGKYNIEVSGFRDLAGFTMNKQIVEFNYQRDVTKPTAELVSQSQTELVIRFNEPVTLSTDYSNYYHTFAHYTVSEVPSLVPGTVSDYKFTFAEDGHPIPAGQAVFYIKTGAVTDDWGNKMGFTSIPVTVTSDTKSPNVVSAVHSNGTVIVTFDEPVTKASAENTSNYLVKLDTRIRAVRTASYDANSMTVTLTFYAVLDSGRYSIAVKNVTDSSLNRNAINENLTLFSITDEGPIDTTKVTASMVSGAVSDIIYLTYPEEMNATALDTSYYMLKTGTGTVKLSAKTVRIEPNGATTYKITRSHDDALVPGSSYLVIGRVQDAAGNAPAEFSFDVLIVPEAAPTVEALIQTAANRLAVTFNKELSLYSLEAFLFRVNGGTHTPAMFDSVVKSDGKTTLSFILTADMISAIKKISPDYETNTAEIIGKGDLSGITLELRADRITSAAGMRNSSAFIHTLNTDRRAPELKSLSGFNLIFSEPIAGENAAYIANDLIIKKDDKTLLPGIDYFTTVNAQGEVAISVPGGATSIESAATINVVRDAAGNKALPFTARKLLQSFLSPVYSGKITYGGALTGDVYQLPTLGTGSFTIEFDVTYLTGITSGYVGFISTESLPYSTATGAYYLSSESILCSYEDNSVKFINSTNGGADDGGSTTWNSTGAVSLNVVHRIKLVCNVTAGSYGTYDAYFDGALIGSGMGFMSHGNLYGAQTRHDVTKPSGLAAISIVDTAGGKIKVENLRIR